MAPSATDRVKEALEGFDAQVAQISYLVSRDDERRLQNRELLTALSQRTAATTPTYGIDEAGFEVALKLHSMFSAEEMWALLPKQVAKEVVEERKGISGKVEVALYVTKLLGKDKQADIARKWERKAIAERNIICSRFHEEYEKSRAVKMASSTISGRAGVVANHAPPQQAGPSSKKKTRGQMKDAVEHPEEVHVVSGSAIAGSSANIEGNDSVQGGQRGNRGRGRGRGRGGSSRSTKNTKRRKVIKEEEEECEMYTEESDGPSLHLSDGESSDGSDEIAKELLKPKKANARRKRVESPEL